MRRGDDDEQVEVAAMRLADELDSGRDKRRRRQQPEALRRQVALAIGRRLDELSAWRGAGAAAPHRR